VSASFYLFKLKNKIEELNDKIVKISRFDEQTNVYKRMYLFEMADKYINTAQRKHIPMSIMLVDIDDFKFYNKRYGHEFSDKILKKIAQIIKRNTRGMDIVGRFGGDEFIIISLGNRNELMSLANRINKEVRNLKIENMNLNISVSAGISEFQKGDKLIDVIKRAEEALFLAKEKGGARADYLEHFLLFE
jgi:diguanylate cyclase (GGDEF)-like protein